MSQTLNSAIAIVGVDIGKNSFHVVGLDQRDAIVLRQQWSRGQVAARFANMPPCLVGMEACVGAHHLSRKLKMLGHDARLMPASASFHISSGTGGSVEIIDPPVVGGGVQSANIALFGNYIAASLVTAAGGQGGHQRSAANQPAAAVDTPTARLSGSLAVRSGALPLRRGKEVARKE